MSFTQVLKHDSLKFRILDYNPSEEIENCMILLHAIGGRLENWLPLIENFAQTGKSRLIAFDLRGHGQSSVPKGKYTVPTYIEDLEIILNHLEVKEPFILLNHSITGIISLAYALQCPKKVQGLVTISFAGKLPPLIHKGLKLLPPTPLWGPLRKLARKELIKYAISQSSDTKVAEDTIKFALKTKNRPVSKTLRSFIPFSKDLCLNNIQCPVLIITGKEDKAVCPEDLVKECENEIPQAKSRIFDKASHLVHLEWPIQVNQQIHEFVSKLT
ncbi:MAG: alpha/beta fold hydrolase [Candidatus Hodarchaeota archaeon]